VDKNLRDQPFPREEVIEGSVSCAALIDFEIPARHVAKQCMIVYARLKNYAADVGQRFSTYFTKVRARLYTENHGVN